MIEKVINKLYHKTTRNEIKWNLFEVGYYAKYKKWNLYVYHDLLKINIYKIVHPEVLSIWNWLRWNWLRKESTPEEPEWLYELLKDLIEER